MLTGEVLEVFLDRFPEVFEAFIEGSKSAGEADAGDVAARLRQTAWLAGPSGFRPTLELFLDHFVLPADSEVRLVHLRRFAGERDGRLGEVLVEYGRRVRSVSPNKSKSHQNAAERS